MRLLSTGFRISGNRRLQLDVRRPLELSTVENRLDRGYATYCLLPPLASNGILRCMRTTDHLAQSHVNRAHKLPAWRSAPAKPRIPTLPLHSQAYATSYKASTQHRSSEGSSSRTVSVALRHFSTAKLDPELDLLGDTQVSDANDSAVHHAVKTAPAFTADAFETLGPRALPQRALYGRLISQHSPEHPEQATSPKLYINTNTPFSALICGVQVGGIRFACAML